VSTFIAFFGACWVVGSVSAKKAIAGLGLRRFIR
jgi:hypothetical protein